VDVRILTAGDSPRQPDYTLKHHFRLKRRGYRFYVFCRCFCWLTTCPLREQTKEQTR